ncbi:hypothetical protein ACLQ2Q_15615 [Microbacterium sp. DT81.1]|uniref:hypothetical protein n=1 Tax=Microbacterium sp. DT81.1 TaxID=3393413 RepID=UPI003CE671DA
MERVANSGPLQTLSDAELELGREPFTRDPQPKPVKAWVRFGETPVLVDAEACVWTSNAVGIRFTVAGKQLKTWVWASAVRTKHPAPSD